ncbi:hypothetical protein R3P38DRAFT_2914376 [Favolaschia claudopus]|uniref:Uncharacterized protein n=1 Tax=Favolaschia claudopus TaxID=2862362 RepID=A0AAW0C549_9AGAR
MHFAYILKPALLFLAGYAFAQLEDTIGIMVPSQIIDTTTPAIFTYAWVGNPGHELKNISMELVAETTGSLQGNNDTVVDIIAVNYTQQNGNSFLYPLHTNTPAGTYYVRMNATIFNASDSPLTVLVRPSQTFNISLPQSFPCQTPDFTPVGSIFAPSYTPLRLASPAAGAVFSLQALTSPSGDITGMLKLVDALPPEGILHWS